MSLKDLYNAKGLNRSHEGSQISGRHGNPPDNLGPDTSYNQWPGWISGDAWLNGNINASSLNIDSAGQPAPPFVPPEHWSDNPISQLYEAGSDILDVTLWPYDSLSDSPMLNLLESQSSYLSNPDIWPNNPDTLEFLNLDLQDKYQTYMDNGLFTYENDTRFAYGIGWDPFTWTIQTAWEGGQASIYYTNTISGKTFTISGAINAYGELAQKFTNLKQEIPIIPFSASFELSDIIGPKFLRYQDTVYELTGGEVSKIPDNEVSSLKEGKLQAGSLDPDSTRGIAFQVMGEANKSGVVLDKRFQDKVENVLDLSPSGFISVTGGGIELKKDYFKNVGSDIRNALGLPAKEGSSEDESENDAIQSQASGVGINKLSGFGNPTRIATPTKKIDGSSGWGSGGGISGFISNAKSTVSGWGDTISDFGDTVGGALDSVGNAFQAALPIDIDWPMIRFKNPFKEATKYGGQAVFRKNQPRALSYVIPLKMWSLSDQLGYNGTPPSGINFNLMQSVVGSQFGDEGTPRQKILTDRVTITNSPTTPYSELGKSFYAGVGSIGLITPLNEFYPNKSMDEKAGGDRMTLAHMNKNSNLANYSATKLGAIDSQESGMPFYFKDLRDSTYVILRGYLSGITNNVSPSWDSTNYVGRSEAVYTYARTDRSLSFSINLAAQTGLELDAIYSKLTRLTAMCYPQYLDDMSMQVNNASSDDVSADGNVTGNYKERMKPPLLRLRIGELFGNSESGESRNGTLGFLKSITYQFPDNSPWEFRKGQRVPKFIEAQVEYQIIHDEVPEMSSREFFGYYPSLIDAENIEAETDDSFWEDI